MEGDSNIVGKPQRPASRPGAADEFALTDARVRYFLAVCEHGSFTQAAKACGVTQPSVTAGVRRLERAVKGRLFERRHPVKLTMLGARLRPMLEEIQAVNLRVAALLDQSGRSGDDIGAPPESATASDHVADDGSRRHVKPDG
jgi:DNA-binding transcriptional LysR family regulator